MCLCVGVLSSVFTSLRDHELDIAFCIQHQHGPKSLAVNLGSVWKHFAAQIDTAFFCLGCAVCGILVPWPGIEPTLPAVEAQSLNHWITKQVSCCCCCCSFSHVRLCDPIDGSPLGSAVPGILQARTLEWVAWNFPNAWKWKVKVKSLSRVWLFETPWTAAYQTPPPMGFSRPGVLEWGAIAFSEEVS